MSIFDKEMQKALEADGEKLRQMTGEDHGPYFFNFEEEDAECWDCGGEGVVYDCFEEWACVDPESGCDECMRRCDVCHGKRVLK
jgi:hypothetical protein